MFKHPLAKKSIIFAIAVVLVCAAVAVVRYNKNQGPAPDQGMVLADKTRALTEDQKKIYEDRLAKAQEYLKTIKPSQPDYVTQMVNTYVNLAQQYYGLGKLEQSKQAYYKALALDKNNEQALIGLSLTLIEGQDTAGGQKILEQALASNPKNYDVWLRYIQLRQTMGLDAAGLDDLYKQALEKTGRYADILAHYAQFLEQQGNIKQALLMWQEALKQYPDNSAYKQEVARLKKK